MGVIPGLLDTGQRIVSTPHTHGGDSMGNLAVFVKGVYSPVIPGLPVPSI